MLKPVIGEPALLHGKTLAIADLHLGYGHELSKDGIRVPSEFAEAASRIKELLVGTGAKNIVFLGDVKHSIPVGACGSGRRPFGAGVKHAARSINPEEWREFPGFFRGLAGRTVSIAAGNHDGGIRKLAPEWVGVAGEVIERDVVFTHGSRWISERALKCRTIVMAHMHPVVRLEGGLGRAYSEPVWVRGDVNRRRFEERYSGKCSLRKFIIMPAFSAYAGGNPVNRPCIMKGPYLRNGTVDFSCAKLYLLDGTFLGTAKDLNA